MVVRQNIKNGTAKWPSNPTSASSQRARHQSKRSVHSPVWQDHWDIVPLTTSLSSTEYKEISVYSGIYPAMKTNETRSFVTAWVELEITTCHTPVREQSITSAASEI